MSKADELWTEVAKLDRNDRKAALDLAERAMEAELWDPDMAQTILMRFDDPDKIEPELSALANRFSISV